jgi:hypothetical protein
VVGLTQSPLGGQASDAYIKLGQLQKASDREGRVNTVQVRADDGRAIAEAVRARQRIAVLPHRVAVRRRLLHGAIPADSAAPRAARRRAVAAAVDRHAVSWSP